MTFLGEVDVTNRSTRDLGYVVVTNFPAFPAPPKPLIDKQILLFPMQERGPDPVDSDIIESGGHKSLRISIYDPSASYVAILFFGVDYSNRLYQIGDMSIGPHVWSDGIYRFDVAPGISSKLQGVPDQFGNTANKALNDILPARWVIRLVGDLGAPSSTHTVEVSADLLV